MSRFLARSLPSSSHGRRVAVVAAGLLVAFGSSLAQATVWGSFEPSRMAYATGALQGAVHSTFRGLIEDHGDEVATGTDLLTPEYLAGVDVFYTAMLSDGTGPTAGALGTLSLDERAALQEWIAAGGTLIVTPDSNGFDGPFPIVYDSWLADYGVTDFVFVFSFAVADPVVVHPITDGVGSISLDGYVTYTYPSEGEILATVDGGLEPLIVVLEPQTGFTAGGRILVVSDHNAFTNNYIGDLSNTPLAENIIAWAAAGAECGDGVAEGAEECDDGNLEDGDGCSSTCMVEEQGTTGLGTTDGDPDGSGEGTGGVVTGTGPADGSTGEGVGSTGADEGPMDQLPDLDDGSDDGCGCHGGRGSGSGALLPLLLVLGASRRRGRGPR